MADTVDLTHPLAAADLREAYPRALRAVKDTEVDIWLEILEDALRTRYGVRTTSTDQRGEAALRRAMIACWPSFYHQVRNLSSERTSVDGYSAEYGREKNRDFDFPGFLSSILGPFGTGEAGPTTTELVR